MDTILLILDILSIVIGLSLVGLTVYRKPGKIGAWLVLFGITLTIWALFSLVGHLGFTISPRVYRSVCTVFMLALPTALLITSMNIAQSKYTVLCLAAFIVTCLVSLGFSNNLSPYLLENIYSIAFLGLSAYFIQKPFTRSDYQYRRKANIIFAALLLVWLMFWNNLVARYYANPLIGLYLYACTGLVLMALVYDLPKYELAYSREQVLENMPDGWMLLNDQGKIADLNPAASSLLSAMNRNLIGMQLDEVLQSKYNITVQNTDTDINLRIGAPDSEQIRFANLHIVPLKNKVQAVSKIVFWRDVTEFQKAELARQHARDEMSMLLHVISRAAIEYSSQKEFLRQALLQIVYSFNCKSGIFWLYDISNDKKPEIVPTAAINIPAEDVVIIAEAMKQSQTRDFFTALDKHHYIPDSKNHSTPGLPLDKLDPCSLLVEPLFNGNQSAGMIWLIREPNRDYSPEELTRLALVLDEVATLNYFNKQNQAAVIATERQRLMRDLHDSVTQRLYGLVALTEAAQAGLANGMGQIQPQIITRIGEHARQAIKEMRLFLHQLQTVSFEKENLVMLLHRRLAAVEGRSDVHSKFDPDLTIVLSAEKQKALYYIAQEALNNTLRHACAKNVTLSLKKSHRGVVFTIADDGLGFNQLEWDTGGMGIRNMRARAKEINARLYLKSAPGQGTQVKVFIPNDSFAVGRVLEK